MKAEIRAMLPRAKESPGLPATQQKPEEGRGTDPPSQLAEGASPARRLLLAFQQAGLRADAFLLFKPPGTVRSIAAACADQHHGHAAREIVLQPQSKAFSPF